MEILDMDSLDYIINCVSDDEGYVSGENNPQGNANPPANTQGSPTPDPGTPNQPLPEGQDANDDEDTCGCDHQTGGKQSNCSHGEVKSLPLEDQDESVCCRCGQPGSNVSCSCVNCCCTMHSTCPAHSGSNEDNNDSNESSNRKRGRDERSGHIGNDNDKKTKK
jgi:hypothetical protein